MKYTLERTTFMIIRVLISIALFGSTVSLSAAFIFHWEIDGTPEGSESATIVAPVQVTLLDEPIQVVSHSASLALMRKYSVHLGTEWSPGNAYRLLQTFESIPQETNHFNQETRNIRASVWRLSNRHIQNDIEVEFENDQKIVTIAEAAFTYAEPLLAEIEGVRGRFFSKRLHRAVIRFVTDDGADRSALERILQERYAVSINVPDYTELTQHTTGEDVGRFSMFKNEELIAIASMLEEFPSAMHKTPGLRYLVRRLDGTPHPTLPEAIGVAWITAGYIEFMEGAFRQDSIGAIHRTILHEKAHFLWGYLFDDQLKQDWMEVGGWYENPESPSGSSTTKQVEFVSAYAHSENPDEDMAESISFYITAPDKLRSRSLAKYEFIQNRIMHGTRYISKIREDLTFEVYNLYPDYVYPGRIIRVDIQVTGEPEEDKIVTVEIEIHGESTIDTASGAYANVYSEKGTSFGLGFQAIGLDGAPMPAGHILRGQRTLSKHAANGYWAPNTIRLSDANGNERFHSKIDFGWKLYIDNPLADNEPPEYVKNSIGISLSEEITEEERPYQILTVCWKVIEKNRLHHVLAKVNDEDPQTYSLGAYGYGGNDNPQKPDEVCAYINIPDYYPTGTYAVNYIRMMDVAGNYGYVYFTGNSDKRIDELPATIKIQTENPDNVPPVLDLNRITIKAEPTQPKSPNGETRIDITFRIKDNISGYKRTSMYLEDPQGIRHYFNHSSPSYHKIYFFGDPTVFETYHKTIILPIGSVPGIWGLAHMTIDDKAGNSLQVDFTEIVRFEVEEGAAAAPIVASLPEATELLANYPNPFNPETWIPYQLATNSDVQITIYDTKGIVVRTLPLGHQTAGYYTNTDRAAYWDGCNGLGENVASGVYFYQLQADNISRLRKMLIVK